MSELQGTQSKIILLFESTVIWDSHCEKSGVIVSKLSANNADLSLKQGEVCFRARVMLVVCVCEGQKEGEEVSRGGESWENDASQLQSEGPVRMKCYLSTAVIRAQVVPRTGLLRGRL